MNLNQVASPLVVGSGGKQRTIYLFGDSHSHAVHRAATKWLAKGIPVPLTVFRPRKRKETGEEVGNTSYPEFLDLISKLEPDDVVFSMLGGNEYAAFSTFQHPQPFDFFDKAPEAFVAPGTEVIPYKAIAAALQNSILQGPGRALKMLKDSTRARLVHIIPPPPIADNVFIAGQSKRLFNESGFDTTRVSPPQLRLKCWELQRHILYKLCRKSGIKVMPVPPKSSEGGFLRAKYYGHDAHHANAKYGELILREVQARFVAV